MIRIEDEEDVEAYKEAKAELDDEFDEDADVMKDKKEETRVTANPDEAAPVPEGEIEQVAAPEQVAVAVAPVIGAAPAIGKPEEKKDEVKTAAQLEKERL